MVLLPQHNRPLSLCFEFALPVCPAFRLYCNICRWSGKPSLSNHGSLKVSGYRSRITSPGKSRSRRHNRRAERPQGKPCYLEELLSERNADNGDAKDTAETAEKSTENKPDDVRKAHSKAYSVNSWRDRQEPFGLPGLLLSSFVRYFLCVFFQFRTCLFGQVTRQFRDLPPFRSYVTVPAEDSPT